MLKQLAAEANLSHRWACASANSAIAHVISAGNALCRARDLCEPREWTRWAQKNFRGSMRTAQRYIRLAEHASTLACDATRVSRISQSEALRAIRSALIAGHPDTRVRRESESVPDESNGSLTTNIPPRTGPTPSDAARPRGVGDGRVAARAVAGLEALAGSLRAECDGDFPANAYVITRVESLALDLRIDTRPANEGDATHKTVYFAEAVGTARVKIGVALDPKERVAALQTACPHPIRLLGTTPGGADIESALHRRFRDYHIGGEWFHLATPLREYVARIRQTTGATAINAGDQAP